MIRVKDTKRLKAFGFIEYEHHFEKFNDFEEAKIEVNKITGVIQIYHIDCLICNTLDDIFDLQAAGLLERVSENDREIKFRGQDRDKKWHFGDLHHYFDGAIGIREIENKYGFVVDPETVGQFTGFKDIDGKEIYEGDIIQNDAHPDTIERVFMYDGCWSVGFYPDEANPLAWTLENAPFKVIGNIHDNPKLLEGGQ